MRFATLLNIVVHTIYFLLTNACTARKFLKIAVKSTIFELQQSFLHIFGVAQNFQFNGGGAQSRIPLSPPTFWNSYPAYQKNPISNPPYPISFPNLQIPHTKKFNDKILHTKKNERQILLSRFLFWPQNFR